MTADHLPDDRFAVQRPAVVRFQGSSTPATCTSIGLGGGFLSCEWVPELGAVLEVAIQPRRASRDDIELYGRVVMLSRTGGPERRGFGVRWVPAQGSIEHGHSGHGHSGQASEGSESLAQGNVKPLEMLVNWARNMTARGGLDTGSRIADTVLDPMEVPEIRSEDTET